ncbi:MAG: alpha/beta hydrolase-fold protein [Chloroflexi bacterium OHK40]
MHSFDRRARPLQLYSHVLGVPRRLFVYLPPEYTAFPQRRFPTLLLLRGHEREWVNPREDESRGGTTVIDVYERLRSAGTVGPLILVMPGLASDDNTVPGMLTDFRSPERAAAVAGVGSGLFQRYFFEELLPFVDLRLRTLPTARAVAGFSLGGYMAVKAAALHPELFASVGAFDASIPYTTDGGRRARPGDSLFAPPMFDAPFGLPRDEAHLTANNPVALLMRADPAAIRRLTWIVQYGPEQLEPWGSNFYRGEFLLRALRTLGVENAAPLAAPPDSQHTWQSADRHIEQTLPIHWRALSARMRSLERADA